MAMQHNLPRGVDPEELETGYTISDAKCFIMRGAFSGLDHEQVEEIWRALRLQMARAQQQLRREDPPIESEEEGVS